MLVVSLLRARRKGWGERSNFSPLSPSLGGWGAGRHENLGPLRPDARNGALGSARDYCHVLSLRKSLRHSLGAQRLDKRFPSLRPPSAGYRRRQNVRESSGLASPPSGPGKGVCPSCRGVSMPTVGAGSKGTNSYGHRGQAGDAVTEDGEVGGREHTHLQGVGSSQLSAC